MDVADETFELRQNLEVLEEKINEASKVAREAKKTRDDLHAKIKELAEVAKAERESRDKVNEEVKKIKGMKDALIKDYNKKKEEFEKLQAQVTPPSKREERLEKELKRLEWEYQTSAIPPSKAKEMEERILQLEAQLKSVKQYNENREKLEKMRAELRETEAEFKAFRDKLEELANEAHSHHKKMLEAVEQIKALRAQADEAHMRYLASNTQLTFMRAQKIAILKRLNEVNADRNIRAQLQFYQKAKEKMEELNEKAKEKVSKGKRLSFQEFQAYVSGAEPLSLDQQAKQPNKEGQSESARARSGTVVRLAFTMPSITSVNFSSLSQTS
ncbi:MAG: hypothetical protein RXR41_00245 [Candidatus Marsarchaeota archaeon]